MKKLFSDQIYDMLPFEGGFIVVYRRNEVADRVVVSYKSVSLSNGVVSQRTKTDYEFIKFGELYKSLQFEGAQFITCKCTKIDNDRLFVVTEDGHAKIFDKDGYVEWEGTVRYKDCGPSDVAHHGHTLWASFAERNALIRFNLRTMREELRIGGSTDSSFDCPTGLWVNEPDEQLVVCNAKANNILEVNIKTYTVHEKASFEEPVHRYMRIEGKEFALLDSGLYLL